MPEPSQDEITSQMQTASRSNRGRLFLLSGVGLVVVFLGPVLVRSVFHNSIAAKIVYVALIFIFLCVLAPMTYRWFRGLLTVTDPYLEQGKSKK
ncbi:hypothetical protein [Allobranchiibius sp. GilTou38]|uniref:hypothetical protein n=1 Tax=Allobranchiibius sp. GilTou38 TaxID=2815210 RepID=UPI001AA185FE|nr:hypothetical protein [Allobranchiibius sp. GilTou38]MBO1766447.1 hypothetical protein [Allobranchiibius sp. GilTou38]